MSKIRGKQERKITVEVIKMCGVLFVSVRHEKCKYDPRAKTVMIARVGTTSH